MTSLLMYLVLYVVLPNINTSTTLLVKKKIKYFLLPLNTVYDTDCPPGSGPQKG